MADLLVFKARHKTLYSPRGVDNTLFACVKGMAAATDIGAKRWRRTPRLPS